MSAGTITILLVDDHRLVRDSWSNVLNNEPGFSVIGTASTIDEAVTIAMREKPKIVLMDINLGSESGFDAARLIRKFSPGSKIIGVSMHAMPVYAKKIFQLGGQGYVTKNSSIEELVNAIAEVNAGKKYICAEVKEIINQQEMETPGHLPDINSLTKREIEIVKLIKDGLSSKLIAVRLGITPKTAEVHRYNILKKLQLKNTAALVNFINETGL